MKRLKLLLMMLALLGMMAAVVVFRSPYAPVVGGPADIEVLWEIEDTRTESKEPLVTAMENHGVPLAYDRENNTFYCTLGMENGDAWPELHLTVANAGGVNVLFSDDYTYDWCDEAIRKGYSYELMAYTDKEYSYFNIVFTGLPLICIDVDQEITDEDAPAFVNMSVYGDQAVSTSARIHRRGGLSRGSEKPACKIEYTRKADGTGKVALKTPVLGNTDEMLLLPMPFDRLLMRDRLSWDIYGQMTAGKDAFAARPMTYAETIINGTYMGIYLIMTPFDVSEELRGIGTSHLMTDYVYRTCVSYMSAERQMMEHPIREGAGYELFYSPGETGAFIPMREYTELLTEENDEIFSEKALKAFDLQDMLRMEILLQAGGMTDNVFNNLYIWAEKTENGYIYHYIPWDMDLSWGLKKEDIGEEFENWMYFPSADRLINLDPDDAVRSEFVKMWRDLRKNVLNMENIEQLTDQYEHELNDSGAMLRNAERWGTENYAADAQEILDYVEIRFPLLDEVIEKIAEHSDESILFLERTQFEGKGNAIEWENPE